MSKTITKEDIALLVANASEMFDETGCVPGLDGEEVPAETMVPHAKQYISSDAETRLVQVDVVQVLFGPALEDLGRHHRRAGHGRRQLEEFRKREGGERLAGHG